VQVIGLDEAPQHTADASTLTTGATVFYRENSTRTTATVHLG